MTTKTRGSNRQPSQTTKYRGRNPRQIRALQNTLFLIKGRDLTRAERSAINWLSNP